MAERMAQHGVPHDVSAHSILSKRTGAKNIMSRVRGFSLTQGVLATHERVPESLIVADEDDNYVPCKDILRNEDDEFAG